MNGLSLKINEKNIMINKEMVRIMSFKYLFLYVLNDNNLQINKHKILNYSTFNLFKVIINFYKDIKIKLLSKYLKKIILNISKSIYNT